VHDGYSLKDLVRPDPARVRRNLSAVINFHKFREERLTTYQKYTDKTVRLPPGTPACPPTHPPTHPPVLGDGTPRQQ
jgi:hypothetical protein